MKTLCFLLAMSCSNLFSGQKLRFQQGLAFSLYFGNELKYAITYNPNLSYPLGNSTSAFMPLLDMKISLYNNNLGTPVIPAFRNKVYLNIAFSPTLGYSFTKANPGLPGYIPVFTNTFPGVTQTDFDNNIGFSVTYDWEFGLGGNSKRKVHQRIGNLFVSTKYVYLHYYNDGGPVLSWFGDKEDRYWTGGGSIGTKFSVNNAPQYILLTFDKYSGFNKNAFEASGLLYSDNVNYKDMKESAYNTGKYSLKYWNPAKYIGISVNHWNTKFDFQDWIHRDVSTSPYHLKLQKPYVDFEITAFYEH